MKTADSRPQLPSWKTICRVGGTVAALCLFLFLVVIRVTRSEPVSANASQPEVEAKTAPGPPVYPYSVVPGGIRSIADLRRAMNASGTIFNHFAGFDFEHATYTRVTGCYFISLLKEEIRWTKKCVWLHDEPAITDGNFLILMRCANRVALMPKVPIEDVDVSGPLTVPLSPPEKSSSTTEISQVHDQPVSSSEPSAGTQPHRPLDPPSTCCAVLSPPIDRPRVRVPEADTLAISALATMLSLLFGRRMKRPRP